jgi:hypothetical protein
VNQCRTFPYLVSLVAGLFVTACPGSLADPDRFTEGGTSASCPPGMDEKTIFADNCTSSLCHDAPTTSSPPKASDDPAAGLNLTADVESQVLGVTSSGGEDCDGQLLVDPNDPEGSLFLEKLTAKTPRCGDRMPLGTPLKAPEIDCVRKWLVSITGGGNQDAGAGGSGGAPNDGGSE